MKRLGKYAAAAILIGGLCCPPIAFAWNPFGGRTAAKQTGAKQSDAADAPATQDASAQKKGMTKKSSSTSKPDKAKAAAALNKASRAASRADQAKAKRMPVVDGRPLWAPVSNRYRWSATQQPSPGQRAVQATVSALTLKPLRDKLSGNSAAHNPWSNKPPLANTANRKQPGFLGRLFAPKPKPKAGPQTVSEWINQERPGF